MVHKRVSFAVIFAFAALAAGHYGWARQASAQQPKVDFVRDVQPIFAAACAKCHFGEKVRGIASRQ
jgi:mono/diheme cytochrome c family protein